MSEAPLIDLHHGDMRAVLATLPANVVSACVTDPPYGLSNNEPNAGEVLAHWLAGDDYHASGGGFMGKGWDSFVPGPSYWRALFRVLKPGAHALVFGHSRTSDLLGIALRLAGFEVRDTIMWLHGEGFPKSHDVSKAIDKAAGAEREVVGYYESPQFRERGYQYDHVGAGERQKDPDERTVPIGACDWEKRHITAPATALARQWDGWGTALKPAHEPILVVRKPFAGAVAANVVKHGTGAINVDGCRIGTEESLRGGRYCDLPDLPDGNAYGSGINKRSRNKYVQPPGRWPANVALDEAAAAMLDEMSGERPSGGRSHATSDQFAGNWRATEGRTDPAVRAKDYYRAGDTGGASRFFYCSKASQRERNIGHAPGERNTHPTVKPLALMRWLVTLVAPPGGLVIDPFLGSGTTALAAMDLGVPFLGIDDSAASLAIARKRIAGHASGANAPDDH